MYRCVAESGCEITEETNFNKKTIKEDIDIKVKELLKFQYNMIEKLDEVIKKLDKINL